MIGEIVDRANVGATAIASVSVLVGYQFEENDSDLLDVFGE